MIQGWSIHYVVQNDKHLQFGLFRVCAWISLVIAGSAAAADWLQLVLGLIQDISKPLGQCQVKSLTLLRFFKRAEWALNGFATPIKVISGVLAGRASHDWLFRNLCTFSVVPRWRATSQQHQQSKMFTGPPLLLVLRRGKRLSPRPLPPRFKTSTGSWTWLQALELFLHCYPNIGLLADCHYKVQLPTG
eukprot:1453722-Pleurochrysis_carterae.AAC.1